MDDGKLSTRRFMGDALVDDFDGDDKQSKRAW